MRRAPIPRAKTIGRRLAGLLLAAVALAACGRGGDFDIGGSGVIRFSVLSQEPADVSARKWRPVLADMETSTGLKVRPLFDRSDAALVQAMRERRTDLGWFSNFGGLEAVRRAGGEVFARTVDPSGDADGGAASVLIVGAKSRLTLDKVLGCGKTLSLGLGEAFSTAGALAPETYLFAPKSIRPAACFRQVRAGGLASNIAAVAAGQVDVAASSTAALALSRRGAGREADAVRVIWTSPILPQEPIIWRRDLDPAIKEKLRQFFLTYGQDAGPAAAAQRANLARIGIGGFKSADDSHLLPIREMEATRVWMDAKASGDKGRIDAARKALGAITVQRQDLEARTRAPAAAQ
ncbi:MAG TPA: phosphate/phosphite/phosphonate ABC transporter substrate-binding protein [Caulobacteraceae bacterium]|jgi:phosphonate transport system substrate-binding protein|nr:phosphate/phosphite/phosphonate ABC transporter substrate-binding protein [Caulobacteraceae bacterium]